MKAILDAIKKYDIVLVPANSDVIKLLTDNNIEFLFILPSSDIEHRKKLLERYKQRGNNNTLINNVMHYFDHWSRNQNDYDYPITILYNDKYLEDLLIEIGLLK